LKSSGEQKVPTWTKHLGSKKGHGFSGGSKPLKRRYQAERFDGKTQEWRVERKLFIDHLGGEKL